jgi:hypothetical protein
MTDEKPEIIPYIDDLSVREVYADRVQTLFGEAGMLRIELCATRWSQVTPIRVDRQSPVARVAISLGLASVLRDQLSRCIELAEKQQQLVQAPAGSPRMN